ncbi:sensor histidine kinase [Nocardioides ferulae]|uniref:sensor histidine kinase n=1 Tax=Nocardioides ferulae TaxID=2340821 RepID=UPI001F0C6610|nr:sensor histidine kinase [Nocardioides ferulae]
MAGSEHDSGGEPSRPGPLRLTGYAAEQLLLLVPLLVTLVLVLVGALLVVVWIGIPLVIAGLAALRAIAQRQRRVAARVLGSPVPTPYRPLPPHGVLPRLRTRAADPMTWRDLLWLLWAISYGWVLSLVVVVLLLAVVTGFLWWFGTGPLLRIRALVDRGLLTYGSTELLERRVQVLAQSRADVVDHSAAELRRLERDLHDGPQARLVALSMSLGMAEEMFDDDPEAARRRVGEARQATTAALGDLRSLVRGIHPPVLADRGLDGAVRALALDLTIPVDVTGGVPGRAPAPVESALYFAVAECLANATKHARPTRAGVHLEHRDGLLRATVTDDGIGGADPDRGTGLRGVARRLGAFDGRMEVSSPGGGPTVVSLEVPCALPSPKTTHSSGPA